VSYYPIAHPDFSHGFYEAPKIPGAFHVIAKNPAGMTATATVTVVPYTFQFSSGPSLNEARAFPLLIPTKMGPMIVGGIGAQGQPLASTEIYLQDSNTFIGSVPLNVARSQGALTWLGTPLGTQYLVLGGNLTDKRVELYNDFTSTFTVIGETKDARLQPTLNTLTSARNKVLIAGGNGMSGSLSTAELYNGETGQFVYTGSMATPRTSHTATELLIETTVLVAGGFDSTSGKVLKSTEIYDIRTGQFAPGPDMNKPRAGHSAQCYDTIVNAHVMCSILIIGGDADGTTTAEWYDAATGSFTLLPGVGTVGSVFQANTTLSDHTVLIIGGATGLNGSQPSSKASQIMVPNIGPSFITSMHSARYGHIATTLSDGRVFVVGGFGSDTSGSPVVLSSSEIMQ
jgi:hypothetical protein